MKPRPDLNDPVYTSISQAVPMHEADLFADIGFDNPEGDDNADRVLDIVRTHPNLNCNFYTNRDGRLSVQRDPNDADSKPFLSFVLELVQEPEEAALLIPLVQNATNDIHLKDAEGKELIHVALANPAGCSRELLTAIINANDEPISQIEGPGGVRLLHWAIDSSTQENLRHLVENGVDPNALKDGKTMLDEIIDFFIANRQANEMGLLARGQDGQRLITIEQLERLQAAVNLLGARVNYHDRQTLDELSRSIIEHTQNFLNVGEQPQSEHVQRMIAVFRETLDNITKIPTLTKFAGKKGTLVFQQEPDVNKGVPQKSQHSQHSEEKENIDTNPAPARKKKKT